MEETFEDREHLFTVSVGNVELWRCSWVTLSAHPPCCSCAAASPVLLLWFQTPGTHLCSWGSGSSHLVGQRVDSLLQVVVLRVQQRRLFALEGAVGVGVLPELADHGELRNQARNQDASVAAS